MKNHKRSRKLFATLTLLAFMSQATAAFAGHARIDNVSGDYGDITGTTFENLSAPAGEDGGAINNHNGATIGNITADFTGNSVDSGKEGSAIYNQGTIGDISGNFSGNTGGDSVIYNSGTMGTISGDFTNNTAASSIVDAFGGDIKFVDSSFINNFINGGVLRTLGNKYTIAAISKDCVFSGNVNSLVSEAQAILGNSVVLNAASDRKIFFDKGQSVSASYLTIGDGTAATSGRVEFEEGADLRGEVTINEHATLSSKANIQGTIKNDGTLEVTNGAFDSLSDIAGTGAKGTTKVLGDVSVTGDIKQNTLNITDTGRLSADVTKISGIVSGITNYTNNGIVLLSGNGTFNDTAVGAVGAAVNSDITMGNNIVLSKIDVAENAKLTVNATTDTVNGMRLDDNATLQLNNDAKVTGEVKGSDSADKTGSVKGAVTLTADNTTISGNLNTTELSQLKISNSTVNGVVNAGKVTFENANTLNGTVSSTDASIAQGATVTAARSMNTDKHYAAGSNNTLGADYTVAIGTDNTVTGTNSIAIGNGHTVSGNNSGAFGDPHTVTGTGSYAIGNNITINGNDTFVLGSGVTTAANNAVVLGKGSTATEDNVVSVGSAGNERKIINVANATNVTDAAAYGQTAGSLTYNGSKLTLSDRNGTEIDHVTISGGGSMNAVSYDLNDDGERQDSITLVDSTGKQQTPVKIKNVAKGELSATSTDAVTGGQLYETNQNVQNVQKQLNSTNEAVANLETGLNNTNNAVANMQNRLAETGKEVKEVGAMSAALAGLHYVEPSGEDGEKFTAAAAYGGYRGESAAAVGVAYKPSTNLMLSASTSVGNSQNAYNAGVSYKFGKGNSAKTRAGLQKQIKFVNEENQKLKEENAQIRAENAQQNAKIEQQGRENAELKATLNNVLQRLTNLEKGKKR